MSGVVEGAIKLRATWTVEYDAHRDDYAEDGAAITAREMAEMDNVCDDCISLMADGTTVSFRVEPVA